MTSAPLLIPLPTHIPQLILSLYLSSPVSISINNLNL
jgi:hypothetical protein